MTFNRDSKVNPKLLIGIKNFNEVAFNSKLINQDGSLTKEGLSHLRSSRNIISFKHDKFESYMAFHLGMRIKRIWKYLSYAKVYFGKHDKLSFHEWQYLNAFILVNELTNNNRGKI